MKIDIHQTFINWWTSSKSRLAIPRDNCSPNICLIVSQFSFNIALQFAIKEGAVECCLLSNLTACLSHMPHWCALHTQVWLRAWAWLIHLDLTVYWWKSLFMQWRAMLSPQPEVTLTPPWPFRFALLAIYDVLHATYFQIACDFFSPFPDKVWSFLLRFQVVTHSCILSNLTDCRGAFHLRSIVFNFLQAREGGEGEVSTLEKPYLTLYLLCFRDTCKPLSLPDGMSFPEHDCIKLRKSESF